MLAGDPRIVGVRTAAWGDGVGEGAVVTSTGIEASGRATSCHLSVSALAEADGETKTGHGVSVGRSPEDVDLASAASDAVDRSTRLLGAVQPSSGVVTLVLEPQMAATLFGIVGGMLGGEAVAKGRSPFADRVGETIASPLVFLVDDPTDPLSLGADQHDGEGLATRRVPLIDGGVLQGFLHNTRTATKAGTTSTGNASRGGYRTVPGVSPTNPFLEPGSTSQEDLLKAAGRAVYVQEVSGLHSGANPISGEFSVGAVGLRVEGGVLGEPLREMTIASTLLDVLKGITIVGSDLRFLGGGMGAPTVLVGEMTVGGT